MKLLYTVHSCTPVPVTIDVERNGKTYPATFPGLSVELVPGEPDNATLTIRDVPDDMAEALALFAVGAKVQVAFVQVEPPPEPTQVVEEPAAEEPATVDPVEAPQPEA